MKQDKLENLIIELKKIMKNLANNHLVEIYFSSPTNG